MKRKFIAIAAVVAVVCSLVAVLAQSAPVVRSDIVKLTTETVVEWNANPEPDIAGYWLHMQSDTNVFQIFTTNTAVKVFTVNPSAKNGTHSFWVYAVNTAGLESGPSQVLTTNLWRPPGQASKPKVYTP